MIVSDENKVKEYYQALIDRDSSYVGAFFVGVKTTSIFCISTCSARKPKFENVVFYSEFKDALDYGFRPCKVCKPTQNANSMPPQVALALELVKKNPKEKVKDFHLKQNNIQPELVRRWFNKNYGMTFHAYQRMFRVNNALIELSQGSKTTDAAFDNGFDSLSGFGYTYKKLLGSSPTSKEQTNVIYIDRTTTPIGPMFICATNEGLCLLEFVDRRMLETEFQDLQRLLKARIIAGENKHTIQTKIELEEYFTGDRTSFDVKLDLPGTEFQKSAWKGLTDIPIGETRSYKDQAIALGSPHAVRAVGRANGMNRVAIIVPCHRVIGSDGKLTGYGGGLERKRWLLNHEMSL